MKRNEANVRNWNENVSMNGKNGAKKHMNRRGGKRNEFKEIPVLLSTHKKTILSLSPFSRYLQQKKSCHFFACALFGLALVEQIRKWNIFL